jgi:hypothetical protein
MRKVLPKGDWEPGTWSGMDTSQYSFVDADRSANMVCTNGHQLSLINHKISSDGTVSPSVICPEKGCDYHEFITLEGWNGE